MPGSPAHDLEALSSHQLDVFVDTYAQQSIKIAKARFSGLGGLCTDAQGAVTVGALVESRNSNGPENPGLGGPFRSSLELYVHQVEAALSAIKAGQLFRAAPYRAYLAHLKVKDLILSCPTLTEKEHEFYLRHPDGKSDNILIAEDGSVTALLDWQW
jgi:hypothetical protein